MKLTNEQMKEIEDELNALNVEDFYVGIVGYDTTEAFDKEVTVILQDGGCEGDGETGTVIFTYKGNFFRFFYQYESENGTDCSRSRIQQVKPVTKTVTDWTATI